MLSLPYSRGDFVAELFFSDRFATLRWLRDFIGFCGARGGEKVIESYVVSAQKFVPLLLRGFNATAYRKIMLTSCELRNGEMRGIKSYRTGYDRLECNKRA